MKRGMTWLAALLIFASGIVVGGVGGLGLAHHKLRQIAEGGPDAVRAVVLQKLAHTLGLNQEQRQAVDRILAEHHRQIRELRMKHQPEAEAIVGSAVEQIKTHLSPEQAAKLDEVHDRMRRHWSAFIEPQE